MSSGARGIAPFWRKKSTRHSCKQYEKLRTAAIRWQEKRSRPRFSNHLDGKSRLASRDRAQDRIRGQSPICVKPNSGSDPELGFASKPLHDPAQRVGRERYGDAERDGLPDLFGFLGKRDQGEDLERGDHHPDDGEEQPELPPHYLGSARRRVFSSSSAARLAACCARSRAARVSLASSSRAAPTRGS